MLIFFKILKSIRIKYGLLLWAAGLSFLQLQADPATLMNDLLFRNISNEEGLSHSTVYASIQDTSGYMWFGTQDGLNRFDGHTFKIYRPQPGDPGSIGFTVIRSFFIDSSGRLWIGGAKGISLYLDNRDAFRNYLFLDDSSGDFITSFIETSDRTIYAISLEGGLFRLEPDEREFLKVEVSSSHPFRNFYSWCLNGEDILLATESGLALFNPREKSVHPITIPGLDTDVREIVRAGDGGYWIGTDHDGLWKLGKNLVVEKIYRHSVTDKKSLCNNNIRSMCLDQNNQLWIGTFIGLSILDIESATFLNVFSNFGRPFSLAQNSIRSISGDRQGGMWLGTYYGGISFYHPDNVLFDLLNQNGGDLSLSDNVVSCLVEDGRGDIWIGTNDSGVNLWDRKNKRIKVIRSDEKDKNSLSSNNIKSIVITPKGKLLIGTHDAGLNYYDPATGTNRVFKNNGHSGGLSGNNIYAMLRDHTGKLWIGTWNGLDLFDENTQTIRPFLINGQKMTLTSDHIQFLFEDSRFRIWIGTNNGLNILNPVTQTLETFRGESDDDTTGLSNNNISCITEDSKGRIWIGTRKGFNLFDELTRNFVQITTSDGLSNNMVYGILEDDLGFLWISTNDGLSKYDPATKNFRNYGLATGLQSKQFNYYSFCKTSDGILMFGGIKGINLINPRKTIEPEIKPKIVISEFMLFNNSVTPDENGGILKNAISLTKEITLKHNQNVFSFRFSAISFTGNEKIKYEYKLEGWDEKWIPANEPRRANFSNIPPGEYLFRVRIPDTEGVHGDERILKIHILNPWWSTGWAYLAYLLVLMLVSLLAYRMIKEQIKNKNQLRIERIEKKNLEEINQLKLQFFTNISHEFRTPLTLILSPLQKLRERHWGNEWAITQLDLIDKNAQRLLHLVDELMEFRKSEQGMLKLKASAGELVSFTYNIYLSFSSVASLNQIVYTFNCEEEKIEMIFDPSYLEKVIYNLLSNSFKYTPSGGSVEVKLSCSGGMAVLEVTDSGRGIKPEELALVFDRFYRGEDHSQNSGFGIGLALTKKLVELHHGEINVESEPGKGSRFVVRLPVGKEVYSAEEVVVSSEVTPAVKPFTDVESRPPLASGPFDKEDTVLIVDDNPDILNYIAENLVENYNVLTAMNGEEALKLVNEDPPSLVVCDVMMPVLDGMKLCMKLKKNIKTCHIPIILLTAKSSIQDMIEGFETGADDYVVKPFAINLLQVKIDNLIKTRKRLKELYSKPVEIIPEKIALNSLDEELLKKALAIVEKHITEPEYSVDDFAREIGMSRSNLHLKLKAITGESATVFIKKVRFAKALKLLEENRYSIAEISYMVGFSTPSYFSTNFKKYFGYLPSDHTKKRGGAIS